MRSLASKIKISPQDKRVYKAINLENRLNCLLISDKEADKSAACMDVFIGQCEDPIERPGLAHFLEHMLFMGTKKYPDQNAYSSYISSNSGTHNAYTALMNTNYFFDCSNMSFQGALDRFAQFFIDPLFLESCVDREINAVNSEHEKNKSSDNWRQYQLFRYSAMNNHPFNKFGSGNKTTLYHKTIRDDLIQFYQRYYSANLMKLVIYGQQDIDILEKWAIDSFSLIKNYDKPRPEYTMIPFNQENLGNFWKITPVKDKDVLEFTWIIENLEPYYRSNPAKYLSHLIGHEGKNSLLSLLIDEGLALELSSDYSTVMKLFTQFNIRILLTKKGLRNTKAIYNYVFGYLKMLKEKGIQKRIFEEIKQVDNMRFLYKDKEKPLVYTSHLAKSMQYYPLEDIIQLPYLFEEYDPMNINRILNTFSLDNMRIYLISKSIESECDQAEPWYGTKYNVVPIPNDIKNIWNDPNVRTEKSNKILDLPPQNVYVPSNFQIYTNERQNQYPIKLIENDHSTLWFKQDNTFNKPKAGVFLKVYCNDNGYCNNIHSVLLLEIWLKLYRDSIRELLYLISMANVSVNIDSTSSGMDIEIAGFDETLDIVCNTVCNSLKEYNPSSMKDHFNNIHEEMLRNVKNFEKSPAYQQAFTYNNILINKGGNSFHNKEIRSVLEKLHFDDLMNFHKEWLKNFRSEWLIIGNIKDDKAIRIFNNSEEVLRKIQQENNILLKELIPEIRTVNIKENTVWFYEEKLHLKNDDISETNSAIISYYQYEPDTSKSRVLFQVLSNYLKDPCFDVLRTNEQLGYIVSGSSTENRGILGYYILIQSSIAGPQYLSSRIYAFLETMKDKIKNITMDEFNQFVESIRVKIMQKDLSIYQEANRYLYEISKHRYTFDIKERDLKSLDELKKEDMIALFNEIFFKRIKLLETHIVAEKHFGENTKLKEQRLEHNKNIHYIPSPHWFKRRVALYPDFNSML